MLKGWIKMREQSLGLLRSLVVIPNWISFTDPDRSTDMRWRYKNQDVETIQTSCIIFIPANFSRLIMYNLSYLLLYGVGIYWTKFSLMEKTITTVIRTAKNKADNNIVTREVIHSAGTGPDYRSFYSFYIFNFHDFATKARRHEEIEPCIRSFSLAVVLR